MSEHPRLSPPDGNGTDGDTPKWLVVVIQCFMVVGLTIALPLYVCLGGLLWVPFFARHLVIFTLQSISAGSRRQRVTEAALALKNATGAFPRGFRIMLDGFLGTLKYEEPDLPPVTLFEWRIWWNAFLWYFISIAAFLALSGRLPATLDNLKAAWHSARTMFQ